MTLIGEVYIIIILLYNYFFIIKISKRGYFLSVKQVPIAKNSL